MSMVGMGDERFTQKARSLTVLLRVYGSFLRLASSQEIQEITRCGPSHPSPGTSLAHHFLDKLHPPPLSSEPSSRIASGVAEYP